MASLVIVPETIRLVEQTEAHVLVGLLLGLLLLGRGLSSRGSTTSGRGSSRGDSDGTARWDGGELLGTLLDQLRMVLAKILPGFHVLEGVFPVGVPR